MSGGGVNPLGEPAPHPSLVGLDVLVGKSQGTLKIFEGELGAGIENSGHKCSSNTYISDDRISFSISVKNHAVFVYSCVGRKLGVCADLLPTSRPAVAQPGFEERGVLQHSTMDEEDIFWTGRESDNNVGTFKPQRPDGFGKVIKYSLFEESIVSILIPCGRLVP